MLSAAESASTELSLVDSSSVLSLVDSSSVLSLVESLASELTLVVLSDALVVDEELPHPATSVAATATVSNKATILFFIFHVLLK